VKGLKGVNTFKRIPSNMYDYFSEIRFKIARVVSIQKNAALSIVLTSTSFEQLDIDLLDLVEILMKVEKIYGIVIPDEVDLKSLEDLVEYVYKSALAMAC
jgi:acyl carrier protein